jgi:hypothetical protein
MVEHRHKKNCGGALLTTPGMPMFAFRRNRNRNAGMNSHAKTYARFVLEILIIFAYNNFPKVYIAV